MKGYSFIAESLDALWDPQPYLFVSTHTWDDFTSSNLPWISGYRAQGLGLRL